MTKLAGESSIRLLLDIDDPVLLERLGALLAGIPGLELARRGEEADAVISPPPTAVYDGLADGHLAFSPREIEVLNLLSEGASNKAIAERLGISVHTAKFHVRSLLEKLDAVGRTDAVAHAARIGVIHL